MAQLASTFGMSEAASYLWLKQEKIDRVEVESQSTDQALELAAAKRRIRQLDRAGGLAEGQRGVPQSGSRPKSSTR